MNAAHKQRVLIVDDENSNITALTHTLSPVYTVYAAKDGHHALKAAEEYLPNIILLDVLMPGMNGYEVLKLLKSKTETAPIPVVFLTAKSDTKSELEGLSLGAVDYITKPFSPPLLLKRIELHLLVETQKRELIGFNENLRKMVEVKTKTVVELQNAVLKTMAELVEFRDDITGGHVERMQRHLDIMLKTMKKMKVYEDETSGWDIALVLQSVQLHDVGKIAIADSILKKPEKLTEAEFDVIKTHVTFGKKIIEKIKKNTTEHSFLEYAQIFATTHHEKWDGTGYPDGLRGAEIPLKGRILAVIDVYDALVSERPYKKAFRHKDAVKLITEGRGKHFDPALVDVFLHCADELQKITTPDTRGTVSSCAGGNTCSQSP